MLKLYNFVSRKKETFKPVHQGKVGMYVCGPTVYDHCHLGHARGYVSMDILRRYLEYLGYEVRHIMNYTDVGHMVADAEVGEDKVEKKARQEKLDPTTIADKYIKSCEEDFLALNIKPAHFNPRPTGYMKQIIKFVEDLITQGFAYVVNGSVYFSVDKFPDYGKLSGKKKKDLISGARVEINPDKKNPLDFALWIKAPKEHILKWESPWGSGYPGWHIECSVMSYDLLGQDTFDIHGGGNENIFPHNENEVAQSEACLKKPMANFWTLWNMVVVEKTKMGKSLGNFVYIKEALKKYEPPVLRLWIISSHYRSIINYNEKSLEQAKNNFLKINQFVKDLKKCLKKSQSMPSQEEKTDISPYLSKFEKAMNDDLNTPAALAGLYDLITQTNKKIANKNLDSDGADAILFVWKKMNQVFGLKIAESNNDDIPEDIKLLTQKRENARKIKDFATADALRKKIEKKGFFVKDTKEGPQITKK